MIMSIWIINLFTSWGLVSLCSLVVIMEIICSSCFKECSNICLTILNRTMKKYSIKGWRDI